MVSTQASLVPRQIWMDPTPTAGSLPHTCTPFRLTSGGEINIGGGTIITLTQDAAYQPACHGISVPPPIDPLEPGVNLSILDLQDPWYSSTNPQIYAISAVTIVSYMLVIILLITPRTFFVGGAGGGGGFLGQSGVINGAYGSNTVIGIGSRPWLQKLAALTVAISMTLVTAHTLQLAHRQYDSGYQDASELTIEVVNSMEVRVVRVISETFLWLAQAQTLIRLFPRHREKLMIKWIAFALIVLELIFSVLNHFLVETPGHPKRFSSAIPAMNYLFAFSLNACYGAFIIYYAIFRRRFAFYHAHMRNMPLVALLSMTAVLIPVVFFVLDLSKPNVSGWGTYVRWVGSAAASVVVWEWVERIEALERDEKKGGILGREIFDGDEMLDATPDSDVSWPGAQSNSSKKSRSSNGLASGFSTRWTNATTKARYFGRSRRSQHQNSLNRQLSPHSHVLDEETVGKTDGNTPIDIALQPTSPLAVASPGSRTTATSAASTVYVVRHLPVGDPNSPRQGDVESPPGPRDMQDRNSRHQSDSWALEEMADSKAMSHRQRILGGLQRLPNPFRRPRETPPPEVARALAEHSHELGATQENTIDNPSMLERLHLKKTPKMTRPRRPVIVVPAPPRREGSVVDVVDDAGSEADVETSIGRGRSFARDGSMDRDDDSPPERFEEITGSSGSVSPLSNEGNAREH